MKRSIAFAVSSLMAIYLAGPVAATTKGSAQFLPPLCGTDYPAPGYCCTLQVFENGQGLVICNT